MSFAGAALVALGAGGTAWGTRAATGRSRPLDLVGALVSGAALLVAVAGAVALLVPGFLAGP